MTDRTHAYSAGISVVGDDLHIAEVVQVLDFLRTRSPLSQDLLTQIGRRTTTLSGFTRRVDPAEAPGVAILPASSLSHVGASEVDSPGAYRRDARIPGSPFTGTGHGSAVRLLYSPRLIAPGPAVHNREATLVHELTHALRMMHGLLDKTEIASLWQFDDAEEFIAILVENVFRSGLGWPLRANHAGHAEMRVPATFFEDRQFTFIFRRFQHQMGSMAELLVGLDPARFPYNPYRDFAASPAGMGF